MAWVLVTGAAKRLGADIARALARDGHDVVIHYRTSAAAAEAVAEECCQQGVKAETIYGDFSSRVATEDFIARYTARFPNTYGLVNNVGNYFVGSNTETSIENLEALFQTNVYAPYALIKALAPSLEQMCGVVVNIGVAGVDPQRADVYCPAYTASKAALFSLTRSLAKEWASKKVSFNMVSPGYLDNAVDLPADLSRMPMGRAASCDEVARVVAFLVDRKSAYITGQNIDVAGGVRL